MRAKRWKSSLVLVIYRADFDRFSAVMPAKAGIQEDSAQALGYDSRIPGEQRETRNDVSFVSFNFIAMKS